MRALTLLLLATGCTVHSGVIPTEDNLVPATYVQAPPRPAITKAEPKPYSGRRTAAGAATVAAANRDNTVEPTPETMDGARWVIEFDPSKIYKIPLRLGRSTALTLPPGEQYNETMVGNIEAFVISPTNAGSQVAMAITPSEPGTGNMQVATTGGIYSFILVTGNTWVDRVEVTKPQQRTVNSGGGVQATVQAQGAKTTLNVRSADGGPLPSWAVGIGAWADPFKMVIRFPPGPVPKLPALLAGQDGEQMIQYYDVMDAGSTTLVAEPRITEAQLRIDNRTVIITAKQLETKADHRWRQADALPADVQPATTNVFIWRPEDAGGVVTAASPRRSPIVRMPEQGGI